MQIIANTNTNFYFSSSLTEIFAYPTSSLHVVFFTSTVTPWRSFHVGRQHPHSILYYLLTHPLLTDFWDSSCLSSQAFSVFLGHPAGLITLNDLDCFLFLHKH